MKHYAKDFIEFVSHSPTAFHACEAACEALRAAGFSQLKEQEPWAIAPGGGYFLTRNRSAVPSRPSNSLAFGKSLRTLRARKG